MKNLILFLASLSSLTAVARTQADLKQAAAIAFTENRGQVHDQFYKPRPDVLYGVSAGEMAVHIKSNGLSYQLYRVDSYKETEDQKTKSLRKEIDQQTIYRIDLIWLDANTNFSRIEEEALPGYSNYYLENCPNGALAVKSYKGLTLKNIYDGINLHYYEKNGDLKYDYIVAPHANYKQIQIKVEGADISINPDGSLLLITPLGKVQEGAPIVFQNGKQLKATWKIKSKILSFEIENYNPNLELIIDPITRLWATFYGGSGYDLGTSCAIDASNNVYMCGIGNSNSGTVIATTGSHQSTYGFGGDAFLVKFNSNGVRLWGTYYGGSSSESAWSCATDGSGNIYMAGNAGPSPNNVMVTPGCHQAIYNGNQDAFLVKFNANGFRQWGTYYGGTISEQLYCCATDINGNVFLSGITTSSDPGVIASASSHQSSFGGGPNNYSDAFLVKFNGNGVRQWGTYYGGTFVDEGRYCAADTSGNIYMVGMSGTNLGNIIATVGSYQSTYAGNGDAFVVKFDGAGNRIWGSYYGGTGSDEGRAFALDASGNLFMAGMTDSNNGNSIATVGGHQSSFGGTNDAFFVKFDPSGSRLWATYYGGAGLDYPWSCATDASGNSYIAGSTESNVGSVIATSGGYQPIYGGAQDAFLAKFDLNGVRQWGTYYGGPASDWGHSCASDLSGNIYLAGETGGGAGIIISTLGSHQPVIGGGGTDGFLVKFDACNNLTQPSAISGDTSICAQSGAITYSIATVAGATSYNWSLPSGWLGTSNTNTILAMPGSTGIFTVVANKTCASSPPQTLYVEVDECTSIIGYDLEMFRLKVYPNPTTGKVNVETKSDIEITVINFLGQIVYSARLTSGIHQINLETLTDGVYSLRCGNSEHEENFKLLRE